MLPASHCAQSIPAPRALRMTASTSVRSFSGRQLRIAISCRRQQGRDLQKRSGNHPARSRIWIEQEHNRGAPRKGCIAAIDKCASGKALYLVARVHLTEDRESIKAGREMDSPRKG
jgi:hypothetical protein